MKSIIHLLLFILLIPLSSCEKKQSKIIGDNPVDSISTETRNAYRWPFSNGSIWNMPIGSKAIYVAANIKPATILAMTVDEDYIIMTPNEPLVDVYSSNVGWGSGDRCLKTGGLLISLPIPTSFVVNQKTWDGNTPNAGAAVLMPDGHTIKQTQPFAYDPKYGYATSQYVFGDEDLFGTGIYGAHGGSGLSAIGGALRYDELTPTSGPIRHALKVNLYGKESIYYDNVTNGYRWPAKTADGGAQTDYSNNIAQKACRMGALLALHKDLKLDTFLLETQPAKVLAKAFQDYGAYLVDNTGWSVYAIITEWGPNGRFKDSFKTNWGFDFSTNVNTPFGRDMEKIFKNLYVIDNNSQTSVGGGGSPRQPYAPVFKK
jgi:hypothetical protein